MKNLIFFSLMKSNVENMESEMAVFSFIEMECSGTSRGKFWSRV